MAQQTTATDGGEEKEHPAVELESVVVDPDDVIEAMSRNKRDETEQRTHVLRVTPPFEGQRNAAPHVSEDHTRYPSDITKPIHLMPESFVVGHSAGSRHPDFRTEWSHPDISIERSRYKDDVPADKQSEEEWEKYWQVAKEMWEDRVRHALKKTDQITLTTQHPDVEDTTVSVRFKDN